MKQLIINIYIYIYIYDCVFYRLTRDVMQLKKPSNIKNKPNQTKQVNMTKTKILLFVQTNIRYGKFTNSNKQFCGRSNRASIAKLLTHFIVLLRQYEKLVFDSNL